MEEKQKENMEEKQPKTDSVNAADAPKEREAAETKAEAGETSASGKEKEEAASQAGSAAAEGGASDAESGKAAKEKEKADADAPQRPDPRDQKIEELTDRYKRLFAEFDNYRKRTDAEKSGMYADGQRSILEKILPVIDNFERAAGNVPEELKESAYAQGIEKVCRSSMDTLKALGVEPIEAVGKSFDANLHNAVMHVEDEAHGENEIVEEFQRGYKYKDKVIRYSMVKVAN